MSVVSFELRLEHSWLSVAAGLCATLASGCQSELGPEHRMSIQERASLGGWTQAQTPVKVQGYDRCKKTWRTLAQAPVPESNALPALRRWSVDLKPSLWQDLACLLGPTEPEPSARVSLKIVQGDQTLPTLSVQSQRCVLEALPSQSFSAARLPGLLDNCGAEQELELVLDHLCADGESLARLQVPLAFAGNLQRVLWSAGEQSNELLYHYPGSMLIGKASGSAQLQREFRGYLAFLPPAGVSKLWSGTLRFFSNFERAPCGHRDDFGCGYASEDASEEFRVSVLDPSLCPSWTDKARCGLTEGLNTDPGAGLGLFAAIDDSDLGAVVMDSSDVDTWLEVSLSSARLSTMLSGKDPLWIFGTRVSSTNNAAPERQEWLFVDHLLGKSITPELSPILDLLVCQSARDKR